MSEAVTDAMRRARRSAIVQQVREVAQAAVEAVCVPADQGVVAAGVEVGEESGPVLADALGRARSLSR